MPNSFLIWKLPYSPTTVKRSDDRFVLSPPRLPPLVPLPPCVRFASFASVAHKTDLGYQLPFVNPVGTGHPTR